MRDTFARARAATRPSARDERVSCMQWDNKNFHFFLPKIKIEGKKKYE